MAQDKPDPRQFRLLFVLAAVQFTSVVDFVIMMPLGPQFMRAFQITAREFGMMISAYTFSAGLFGLVGALFIDRFDRRNTLLTLYAGFALGTLLCALAPGHVFFIGARVVAGAFAGIMGATVFSIIGDAFEENRRGMATGTVMSAFALASIIGVPFGLVLANRMSWHAPFVGLVGVIALVWVLGFFWLPSFRGHLKAKKSSGRLNSARQLLQVISVPNHIRAFGITVCLMMGSFTIIPYISTYVVNVVGYPETSLPYLYLIGGGATLFSSRAIGVLSDRLGKLRVFRIFGTISFLPLILVTHITHATSLEVILVSTFFMICMNGRMVPSMAMITGLVEPKYRGSFMSVNSSVQQAASGLATLIAGWMIAGSQAGSVEHYNRVGYLACAFTLIALLLARSLKYETKLKSTNDVVGEFA